MKRKVISNMRLVQIILFLCWTIPSFSQGFKVKEFQQNMSDGSAFHAPMDGNGHPCGLVKVRTDNGELKFKGDIVGDVENKTNEYWVFMAQGSKSLNILHPNFLPITVDFASFGIDEVASKATYILTLSEQKFKKEKCGLVTTVKPETASLYINDVLIENISGNGLYQLYLPKGDYVCRIEQKGYRPSVQAITIGKGTQNLNIELESVMAELEVKCKTSTAEIYIDGEKKGNGSWKGAIFAGEHQIEARQHNFESQKQIITIVEKESRTFVIPELKRSMGKISIETIPINLPINVDGKYVGMSPCMIEIETGNHYVSCNSYGLIPARYDIQTNEGDISTVNIPMKYSTERDWLVDTYKKAYNGNDDAISELADTYAGWGYRENGKYYEEAVFWAERYSQPNALFEYECWLDAYCYVGNPEKALELYYPIKTKIENRGGLFLDELYMKYIGDAFLKKNEIDKAIQCFEKAERDGYEGLGDCYATKGNKQLAANYYRKCLNLDYYDGKNRVEKKLKELK